ncbi:MAG TPA: hypothetical protein VJN22_01110, partial [Candidatus Eremiobacteraceae bacterium]|nr:hypothetical protein [Candidatus Eremiobacteraceae bacterium]
MPHISPRLGFTLAAATLGAVVTIGALMPAKSGEDNRPLVQTFGSVTCNKPTPCETYSNKNSGPGALAKSNSGPGLSASSTNGDGADAISQKNGLSAATTNESVSTQRYES